MISSFQSHIENKKLFEKTDNLLVAVSGGIDSMVLCDLLLKANYSFSVAHCNFKLRGEDSDKDAKFVEDFCKKNNLPFFKKEFDTKIFSEEKSISIQMAARELRYSFFEELIKLKHFNYLLTAHHLNDSIETFFINLIRGSGINGLKSMEEKKGNRVRPLIHFTKEAISNFAAINRIAYRTDSSNSEDKYLRNYLRLNIIPKFKELNPSFEVTMHKELGLLQKYNIVITKHFEEEIKSVCIKTDNGLKININQLTKSEDPELLLFEILKNYGFNSKLTPGIYESIKGIPGKIFRSDNYELVKDREFLILNKNSISEIENVIITQDTSEIISPVHLKLSKVDSFKKETNSAIAYTDVSKLVYPLQIRKWRTGDKFKPLGMKGFKKLSDFFVNLKLNQFEKKDVLVLENGNKEIIWVLNLRMDDRYRITEKTKEILRLELFGK